MTSRTFHLGDVLSVTTHRLVSPRRMEGVYDILGWMTGERPLTHQIPRVIGECEGALLDQHPDLVLTVAPKFGSEREAWRWLAAQVVIHGETRDVTPLPADDTRIIHPNAVVIIGDAPGRPS